MPNQFFRWLEAGAQSSLAVKRYDAFPVELQKLLQSNRLVSAVTEDTYECEECPDHCILSVDFTERRSDGPVEPYFHCPTGFLIGIQWLNQENISAYRFEWRQLEALLAQSVDAEVLEDMEPIYLGWRPFARIPIKNVYLVMVQGDAPKAFLKQNALNLKSELDATALVLVTVSQAYSKSIRASLAADNIFLQSLETMLQAGCFAIDPDFEKNTADKLKTSPSLVIDCRNLSATYKGHVLQGLQGIGFRILVYLALNVGHRQTFDEIGLEIWGQDEICEMNLEKVIPNHLTNIRASFNGLSGKKGINPRVLSHLMLRKDSGLTLNLQPQEVYINGYSDVFKSKNPLLESV